MLHLDHLVAGFLIVLVKEVAEAEHNVDFISSGFYCETDFSHFHFDEALGAGETAGHSRDVDVTAFENCAHYGHKVGIDADGGHVGQIGIFVGKGIDSFSEISH